jgi:hypothetical protein
MPRSTAHCNARAYTHAYRKPDYGPLMKFGWITWKSPAVPVGAGIIAAEISRAVPRDVYSTSPGSSSHSQRDNFFNDWSHLLLRSSPNQEENTTFPRGPTGLESHRPSIVRWPYGESVARSSVAQPQKSCAT